MKHITALLFILIGLAAGAAPKVTLSGGARPVISLDPERSSGLEALFVVDASAGDPLTAVYTPSSPSAKLSWSRFSSLGGAYAEPIEGVDGSSLAGLQPGMGYIVEENGRQTCFWVADYAAAPFTIESLAPGEADCASTTLIPSGSGARMTYYSINGRAIDIDREISVSYYTLEYDEDTQTYVQKSVSESFAYLRPELHLPAPLCDTRFTIEGDRFLRQWGAPVSASSPSVAALAVEAHAEATQVPRDGGSNEQSSEGEGIGGSAPVEVELVAAVSDAAIFTEWQFSSSPEFDIIDLRFSDPVMTYTFRETGITYIRFYCANAAGSCDYISEPFTVAIGESILKCPNAFSPNGDGVNDEWRVSYRSIISFDCHIFNRAGKQVAHLTDPSQGWDGKGARPGVYYYVISAEGSDGKHYKLSGDINIIGYK
ncbi:MAG: gliding motility-associated C-terminal domain-containing protein [Pseudoflavonifractor sp.]|nr:gliding motility-associated C-terminal domain-containing protein [Alloprevotella sp.]MCM1117725.1 gliding motility-associated C-terminal domain-containing protein [Pseudoflavonifractor sp.]